MLFKEYLSILGFGVEGSWGQGNWRKEREGKLLLYVREENKGKNGKKLDRDRVECWGLKLGLI